MVNTSGQSFINFKNQNGQIYKTQIQTVTDMKTGQLINQQAVAINKLKDNHVLVRNLDNQFHKVSNDELKKSLDPREEDVLTSGERTTDIETQPFKYVYLGGHLESTELDANDEVNTSIKQFNTVAPTPTRPAPMRPSRPISAIYNSGIFVNPGGNQTNNERFNDATNKIIIGNIKNTVQDAIARQANPHQLKISVSLITKTGNTGITQVKQGILAKYPNANVTIQYQRDYKDTGTPTGGSFKSSLDFDYEIKVVGKR